MMTLLDEMYNNTH